MCNGDGTNSCHKSKQLIFLCENDWNLKNKKSKKSVSKVNQRFYKIIIIIIIIIKIKSSF